MALALNALRKGIETHRLQQRKLVDSAPNIMVGIPTRDPRTNDGRFSPDFVWSLLQLQKPTNYSINFECEWHPDKGSAENRESITERALQSGSKYLIMIDDDMIFPYNTLERFIDDLDRLPDAALITGVIGKKRETAEPEIFKSWDGGRYWDWEKNTVERIWACGGACMAINLDYIRKMKKPYWVDESVDYNGVYSNFSEDLNFCRKIQSETKGRIYLDSHIICGHQDIKTGITYWPRSKEDTKKELKMREANNKIFLIVGVGRTGTTTTAKILQDHFNIPMSMGEMSKNYEDQIGKKLNENVIMGHFSFPYFLAHLEEYVKMRTNNQRNWGFKDPKLSYTLGVFLSIIPDPIIIRCNRNEEQVVADLIKDYGWDEKKARHVYRDRSTRLDNVLDDRPHLVIDFSKHRTEQDIINELNKLFEGQNYG